MVLFAKSPHALFASGTFPVISTRSSTLCSENDIDKPEMYIAVCHAILACHACLIAVFSIVYARKAYCFMTMWIYLFPRQTAIEFAARRHAFHS